MYEGQLVTLKIEGKEALVAVSLWDITSEIDENGLLLKNKKTGETLGYFCDVYGINFYEMMTTLGYDYDTEFVDISTL